MNVYVVLVDWGTMDGYRDKYVLGGVFVWPQDADDFAQECKSRSPFPAHSVVVESAVVQEGS